MQRHRRCNVMCNRSIGRLVGIEPTAEVQRDMQLSSSNHKFVL
jgi:hypothetical protein